MSIENGKVVIHAFHEDDMEHLFKKLGIWGKLVAGEMNCLICGDMLSPENFGALVPHEGKVCGVCGKLHCIYEAQRMKREEGN